MNNNSVVELKALLKSDGEADWVSNLWSKWHNQRAAREAQWQEIDNFLFSVDTSTTANSHLPWTHKSRDPKITQIRDNLHANYLSSLFPNDKWLNWEAYTKDAAKKDTKDVILAYMNNKAREGDFKGTASKLLYDYIDKGVAFAMPTFETRYSNKNGEKVKSFAGPKMMRIAPNDIVFDPTASDFRYTPKIVRTLTTVGALKKMAMTNPDYRFLEDALERRQRLYKAATTYSTDDWAKAQTYQVAGFGSLQEYYLSDTVELLEFYGDYHDMDTGELITGQVITIMDRSVMARSDDIVTYDQQDPIRMVGWRVRQDLLWAQGPLDMIISLQYLLDHYLNMAANALDLKVMPPKKIIGDVEEFEWKPNAEIHIDDQGDVQELAQQFGDIVTTMDFIREIENRMEEYAGAPREAMGIRTPGEKTAFEVQALENAAGRIFQEKTIQFELFLEEILNGMLEEAHRNMDYTDLVRIIDDDIGVTKFREITKEQITADGILRPVGARHFAQRAQELQNLVGIFNSPLRDNLAPHTSGIGLARYVEDVVDLRGYEIFKVNVAVEEQAELQALAGQAEQDNLMKAQMSEEELIAQQQANGGLE